MEKEMAKKNITNFFKTTESEKSRTNKRRRLDMHKELVVGGKRRLWESRSMEDIHIW